MNAGDPCRRLPVCWLERCDILEYIQKNYTSEEIKRFFIDSGSGRLGLILENLERVERMKMETARKNELIEAIHKEVTDGKLTCAQAWALADRFDCPRLEMGKLLNELKIKLIKCQLGCF